MNTFRWISDDHYDKWFFLIYEDKRTFLGWKSEINDHLILYRGDIEYEGFVSKKYPHEVKIVSNIMIEKGWKRMLTNPRREWPKQMIKQVFGAII